MAECGLHIPADDGSFVSVFRPRPCRHRRRAVDRAVAVDLLLAHEKHCRYSSKSATIRTLVLFDELGAGTDPAEGAALANRAHRVLPQVRRRKSRRPTHYAELKLYAMRTNGVINASCEFNVETLQPTYRLLIGIPGKSNAFAISKQLGLAGARSWKTQEAWSTRTTCNFEDVLNQLEQQRQQMEQAPGSRQSSLRLETEKHEAAVRGILCQQIQKRAGKGCARRREKRRRASSTMPGARQTRSTRS